MQIKNPALVDEALEASLQRVAGVRFAVKMDDTQVPPSSRLCAIPTNPNPKPALAIKIVTEAMAPASDDDVVEAMASLEQSTGKARVDLDNAEEAADAKVDRFLRKCANYPADCVLHALDTWDDDHEFFPRWKELRVKLDQLSSRRRRLLVALQAFQSPTNRHADAHFEKSDADKAAVRELAQRFVQGVKALPDPYANGGKPDSGIVTPGSALFRAKLAERRETDNLENEHVAAEERRQLALQRSGKLADDLKQVRE